MTEPVAEGVGRITALLDEALAIADAIDRPLLAALIAEAVTVSCEGSEAGRRP